MKRNIRINKLVLIVGLLFCAIFIIPTMIKYFNPLYDIFIYLFLVSIPVALSLVIPPRTNENSDKDWRYLYRWPLSIVAGFIIGISTLPIITNTINTAVGTPFEAGPGPYSGLGYYFTTGFAPAFFISIILTLVSIYLLYKYLNNFKR